MVIGCLNWPLLALHLKQLWQSTYPQKSLEEILKIRGLAEILKILDPIPPKEMPHWILKFDRWWQLPKWSSLFKNLVWTGKQCQGFLTCDVTRLALLGGIHELRRLKWWSFVKPLALYSLGWWCQNFVVRNHDTRRQNLMFTEIILKTGNCKTTVQPILTFGVKIWPPPKFFEDYCYNLTVYVRI